MSKSVRKVPGDRQIVCYCNPIHSVRMSHIYGLQVTCHIMASLKIITISHTLYCARLFADDNRSSVSPGAIRTHPYSSMCDSNDFQYVSLDKVPVLEIAGEIKPHQKLMVTSDEVMIQINFYLACGFNLSQSHTEKKSRKFSSKQYYSHIFAKTVILLRVSIFNNRIMIGTAD